METIKKQKAIKDIEIEEKLNKEMLEKQEK